MRINHLHPWNLSPGEAIAVQQSLRGRVSTAFPGGAIRSVAGVDMSTAGGRARAAVVVLSYPELLPLTEAQADLPLSFPYIPGLLSFREAPAILAAIEQLLIEPDLFIFDGQGVAHPRRLGIASHIGLWIDKPTIGCAKSRLCGEHDAVGPERGNWSPLRLGDETIGAVLRTRTNVRPVYVSVGHCIDLPHAIEYVLGCGRGYRLPEPTRLAHRLAGAAQQH